MAAEHDPPDNPSTDARIIALEIRIAYQDRLIETLDEVVRDFAGRVQLLERKVKTLESLLSGATSVGPDEPPPHY